MSDDETVMYLIRHGATAANEQRPYILQGGGINHSLSESGQSQARALADFMAQRRVDHVFCSPLIRAVETATAVAERHKLTLETVDPLVEVDVGQWEGQCWDDIMQQHPDHYARFMADPAATAYLGGESYTDVKNRVEPALRQLLTTYAGSRLVVVAHNVVNRAYLAELLGIPLSQAKQIRQTNTGINVIRHTGDETELVTLNACFHLQS